MGTTCLAIYDVGGKQRENLCGMDQLLLSTSLYIYPDAQAYQILSFIIANGGATYNRQDITQRCDELDLKKEVLKRDVPRQ